MVVPARIERARARSLLWLVPVAALLAIFPPVRIRVVEPARVAQRDHGSPQSFAAKFWQQSLPKALPSAVDATELWRAVDTDPASAAKRFGHQVGIGARPVYLVSGRATVDKIDERGVWLELGDSPRGDTLLLTGPIFGNQLRDATGLIAIQDFSSFDFNAISTALNALVEQRVLPELRKRAAVGSHVSFVGAGEFDDASGERLILKIVPVRLTWP